MLRDVGLDEERRALGVEACGQPVDEDLAGVLTDAGGVLVVRRERVPVGDEVETLVLGLEAQEVVERSEEHTSELQSLAYLVCRLLLEKKKKINNITTCSGGDEVTTLPILCAT